MEMEFGWIYLFGWHTHNTIFGGNYKIERKKGWKAPTESDTLEEKICWIYNLFVVSSL